MNKKLKQIQNQKLRNHSYEIPTLESHEFQ